MADTLPPKIGSDSHPNQFKPALLFIIIAVSYVNRWKRPKPDIGKEPDHKVEEKEELGITKLRDKLNDYRKDQRENKIKPTQKAGGNYIDTLSKIRVDTLRNSFNSLIKPGENVKIEQVFDEIAGQLGKDWAKNGTSEQHRLACIDAINSHLQCKPLVENDFKVIGPFNCLLKSDNNEYNAPSSDLSTIVDTFLASSELLVDCEITLDVAQHTPSTEIADLKPDQAQPESEVAAESSNPPSEYCVAHYLNPQKKLGCGLVVLEWKSTGKLKAVSLSQRQEFWPGAILGRFNSLPTGITNTDKILYVILQSTRRGVQMQITLQKEKQNDQRQGIYSSIMWPDSDSTKVVAVGGTVILQTVSSREEANRLIQDLTTLSAMARSGKVKSEASTDVVKLEIGQAIRYQLSSQLVGTDLPAVSSWEGFRRYTGRYLCYYMRLSKSPAQFETSEIEIFPDGTATLQQRLESKSFLGYVRAVGTRLWLFFGRDEDSNKEPIRFLVDKAESVDGKTMFRGIFSSQTLTEKRLVGGRMSMYRLEDKEPWPDTMLSVDHRRVVHGHFINEARLRQATERGADPDIRDLIIEEELKFFTRGLVSETNLTDGPIWAKIAQRLQSPSAFKLVEQLCAGDSPNNKPFFNNQFYYYTFKKEGQFEQNFVIERNLVTFRPNGTVTISAKNSLYEGYAYYLNKTLRLSLTNPEIGFLEVFLELDGSASDISSTKILYGMSLWHSSKRLQGKSVVLSRYGTRKFESPAAFFHFTSDAKEMTLLAEEDKLGGGVISYLRGEINRYMHATTNSSPEQFRPRDQSFRELHFLAACFYGFGLKDPNQEGSFEDIIQTCRDHLEQAYIHGYASSFAGLQLDPNRATEDEAYVKQEYAKLFLKHLSDRQRRLVLNDLRTNEIISRLQELADEQLLLQDMFGEQGLLNHKELLSIAKEYWPDLL